MLMSWLSWLAANWVALLVVLLAFGFIIFVHELGHFMTAKKVGITVHEFALGFGPRLFSRRVGGTEYCLRAFPFGGFVRMEGEDDPDADPNDPGNFQNKSVLSQLIVLGGGCFMNYVSAILVLLAIGFFHGIPDIVQSSVVGTVLTDSPAAKAGLQPGDRIMSVNGAPTSSFADIVGKIQPEGGKPVNLVVDRDHQSITFTVTPALEEDARSHAKVGRIGITPANRVSIEFSPATSVSDVFQSAGHWVVRITLLPVEMVQGLMNHTTTLKEVKEGTGGPLLIGQMLFELYHQGIWALLFFWAIICTSVGSFNLLPIPALDGARMLFVGIGALRGRPLDPRKEGVVHAVGLMLLLAVMAMFTVHDFHRIMQHAHFF